jgi:hypothetical protein
MTDLDLFDVYEPDTTLTAVEYDCDEGSGLFETYGADLDTVRRIAETSPRRVWTLVDTDFGGTAWINGYHLVNRILYAVTATDGQPDETFECLPDED